jgi:hypothetical protein
VRAATPRTTSFKASRAPKPSAFNTTFTCGTADGAIEVEVGEEDVEVEVEDVEVGEEDIEVEVVEFIEVEVDIGSVRGV